MPIKDDVVSVLSKVNGIFFFTKDWSISTAHFVNVASAIKNGQIVVEEGILEAGTRAAYSPEDNVILYAAGITLTDPWVQSEFVHESTHAINDMLGRASISKIDNEVMAWTAQFCWIYKNGYDSSVRSFMWEKPHFEKVYNAVSTLTEEIALNPSIGNTQSLKDLRTALGAHKSLYKKFVGKKASDNRGIGVRGTFESVDTTGKKFKISFESGVGPQQSVRASRNLTLDAAAQVTGKGFAAIPLKLKDPRFKAGATVIVTCEKKDKPDVATWVELVE